MKFPESDYDDSTDSADPAGPPDMAEIASLLSDLSSKISAIQARLPEAAPEEEAAPMLEDEAEAAPMDAPAEDDEKTLAKSRASAMLSKLAQ